MSQDSHKESFITKYIFSQDHKVIGIQYGLLSLFFMLFGFSLMMIMRWLLAYPDEVIPITVPWTNWSWSIFDWYKTRSFAKSFSKKNIDLAFDFKGDFRNSWFLWNIYPKVSFGYNTTGGGYFFTNPQTMNQDLHQSERAEALVSNVGCIPIKEQFDKINMYNSLPIS